MRGERIKSPSVYSWIDWRTERKPFRLGSEDSRRYKAATWLLEHTGEWIGRADIAKSCGIPTATIDSVLADLESPDSPVLLLQDDERPQKQYMAVKRGEL